VSGTPPRASSGLPATFWWLFAGQGVTAIATFVFPFLALFLGSRGLSPGAIGLVAGLYGAGSIPAGPWVGSLADRFGRRTTLLVALVIAALLTALLPLLTTTAALVFDVLALGLAVHAYFPVMNAVVADVLPEDRYVDAYGLLYWERNVGLALSFAVGGGLAVHGYARLFLADAATTFLFACLVFSRVPETRPPLKARRGEPVRGFREVLGDRDLLALLGLLVAFLLVLFQFMVALPIAMSFLGLGPRDYGRAMAVNGLMIALLQPAAARFTRGRDEGKVLALAALCAGAGTGCYTLCQTAFEFAAATALWTLGEILTLPTISALVSRLAPPDLRGRYQGLLGLCFGLGLTLAPALGGVVLGRLGPRWLWTGSAALGASLAFLQLWAGRARARRIRG